MPVCKDILIVFCCLKSKTHATKSNFMQNLLYIYWNANVPHTIPFILIIDDWLIGYKLKIWEEKYYDWYTKCYYFLKQHIMLQEHLNLRGLLLFHYRNFI